MSKAMGHRVYPAGSPMGMTLVILLILVSPALAQNGGLEVPVEFYLGRWAKGTTVSGTGVFNEMYRPHWTVGGAFANDFFRLGGHKDFIPLTGYVEQSSATGYAAFRPGAHYHLALDEVSYVEHEYAIPQGPSHRDTRTVLRASGTYYNTDFVHLSDIWSQYQYAGGTALGEGEMLVRAAFDYRRYNQDEDDPAGSRPHGRETTEIRRTASTGVVYGLSRSFILGADLTASASGYDVESVFNRDLPDERTVKTQDGDQNYSLEAAGTFLIGSGAVMRLFTGLAMASYDREDIPVVIFYPDSVGYGPLEETSVPLRSSERKIGCTISFFSRGAFDPNIIVDDYLGYYKGLSFDGQQRVVAGIEYIDRPDEEPFGYDEGSVHLNGARGFGGGFEASAGVRYKWEKSRLLDQAGLGGDESIRWQFGIRWRSFSYQPDAGPGWNRDKPADIAFSPIQRPEDFYVSLTYRPPAVFSSTGNSRSGFLALSGLKATYSNWFALQWEAGVGYGLATFGTLQALIRKDSVEEGIVFADEGELTIGIRKRLGSMIEIRAEYQQEYEQGQNDPAQVTVNLAGIF